MIGRVRLPLLVFAVVVALGIKFSVQDQRQSSDKIIDVQVTYNSPSEDLISYDRVEVVRVGLRGRSSTISTLSMFNVEVIVNIPTGRPGPTPITLGPSNVQAPRDLEVFLIEPNRFSIQVEPRVSALKNIAVQFEGEPAAGARHGLPTVRPGWAEVSGPESRVRRLTELNVTISLEGHARTYEEQALIISPDPYVQIIEPARALVRIPMEEPTLAIPVEELLDDDELVENETSSAGDETGTSEPDNELPEDDQTTTSENR